MVVLNFKKNEFKSIENFVLNNLQMAKYNYFISASCGVYYRKTDGLLNPLVTQKEFPMFVQSCLDFCPKCVFKNIVISYLRSGIGGTKHCNWI